MGSASNYLETKILEHLLKVAAWVQPTNIYVALSTTDPLDTGAGITEPVGNGYARTLNNTWNGSGGSYSNTNTVIFPTATGAGWGTITHFAVFDAITGGNMLTHGALTDSEIINAGKTPRFDAAQLIKTCD